jgi:hypothetical protein
MQILKVAKRNNKEYIPEDSSIDNFALHDRLFYYCPNCNKETSKEKINIIKNGFNCKSCSAKKNFNPEIRNYKGKTSKEDRVKKFKETCLKKYGVDNPQKNEAIKKKTKQTNLERYGTTSLLKDERFRKKAQEIALKKYGSINNIEKNKKAVKIDCFFHNCIKILSKN